MSEPAPTLTDDLVTARAAPARSAAHNSAASGALYGLLARVDGLMAHTCPDDPAQWTRMPTIDRRTLITCPAGGRSWMQERA